MVQRHRPKQRRISLTAAGLAFGAVATLFGTAALVVEALL